MTKLFKVNVPKASIKEVKLFSSVLPLIETDMTTEAWELLEEKGLATSELKQDVVVEQIETEVTIEQLKAISEVVFDEGAMPTGDTEDDVQDVRPEKVEPRPEEKKPEPKPEPKKPTIKKQAPKVEVKENDFFAAAKEAEGVKDEPVEVEPKENPFGEEPKGRARWAVTLEGDADTTKPLSAIRDYAVSERDYDLFIEDVTSKMQDVAINGGDTKGLGTVVRELLAKLSFTSHDFDELTAGY